MTSSLPGCLGAWYMYMLFSAAIAVVPTLVLAVFALLRNAQVSPFCETNCLTIHPNEPVLFQVKQTQKINPAPLNGIPSQLSGLPNQVKKQKQRSLVLSWRFHISRYTYWSFRTHIYLQGGWGCDSRRL